MTQLNTSELDTAIQDLGSSLSSIINRALTVDDMRMQALSSVEFQADGDGVYGKGLRWQGTGPTKQLIYRSNPDRIWTDVSIDGYIFYNTETEAFGIGTEAPNGKLSIATHDAEFIVDTIPGAVKLGSWTSDDLRILTDDTTRVIVRANGNIDLGDPDGGDTKVTVHGKLGIGVNNIDSDVVLSTGGPVKFENKKFMNGTEEPTSGIFRQGDIVWNENTISTGYIGWVCTRAGSPGEWKPFGQIG